MLRAARGLPPIRHQVDTPSTPDQAEAKGGGRGTHKAGQMNKREGMYANFLQLRKQTGEIREWRFEAVRLTLAPKTTLLPDFDVVMPDWSIELHEVKGFWEDDARVKIKVAQVMFPEYRFVAVTLDKEVGWKFEYFKGVEHGK